MHVKIQIDLSAQFFSYLLTEKRVADNTFLAYNRDIDQLEKFLVKQKTSFDTCKKKNLQNFLKSLKDAGLKAKTLSRKISSIKLFFNFLSERYNLTNVARSLVFPKIEKKKL